MRTSDTCSGMLAKTPARSLGFGIVLMVLGCGLMTLNDAFMKTLAGTLPLGELIFIRSLASVGLLCFALPWLGGWARLRPQSVSRIALNSMFIVLGYYLFQGSLPYMPLTEAIILAYLSPIMVVGLAGWLLHERSTWKQWCAVFVGFAGAYLVINPTSEGIRVAALLPIGAALCIAFRDVLTRKIALSENVFTVAAGAGIAGIVVSALTVPLGWYAPSGEQILVLSAAGSLVTLGQIAMIKAFQYAEAPIMSTLKYSSILWSVLIAYLMWGESLGLRELVGAVLIIAGGSAIVVFRNRRMPTLGLPTVSRQSPTLFPPGEGGDTHRDR